MSVLCAMALVAVVAACTACQSAGNGRGTTLGPDTSAVAMKLDHQMPEVNVLLRSVSGGSGPVEIEAIYGARVFANGSDRLVAPGQTITVEASNIGVSMEWPGGTVRGTATGQERVAHLTTTVSPLSPEPGRASFKISGRLYEGSIQLRCDMRADGRSADGKLQVINVVSMPAYIRGSLASEMPAGWNLEALKAQAVAIRSYTVFSVLSSRERRPSPGRQWDVDDTTAYLRYAGVGGEDGRLSAAHQAVVSRAERETDREVLMWRGSLIKAYFHSTSGGQTTSCDVGFGQPTIPPLAGADLGSFGAGSTMHRWEREIPLETINAAAGRAGHRIGKVVRVSVAETAPGGWIRRVMLLGEGGQAEISAGEFRQLMGTGRDGLPSTNFTVTVERGRAVFTGRGWGHGVGLDQWACKGMADAGHNYRSILRTMYPETEVMRPWR